MTNQNEVREEIEQAVYTFVWSFINSFNEKYPDKKLPLVIFPRLLQEELLGFIEAAEIRGAERLAGKVFSRVNEWTSNRGDLPDVSDYPEAIRVGLAEMKGEK